MSGSFSKLSIKQKFALAISVVVFLLLACVGVLASMESERRSIFLVSVGKTVAPSWAFEYGMKHAHPKGKYIEGMLNALLAIHPEHPTLLNNVAFLQLQSNPESAERLLRKAVEVAPSCGECWNNLGLAVLRKDPEEARSQFESAVKADPEFPDAKLNLAVLEESRADWAKAVNWYEKALENVTDDGTREAIQSRAGWMKIAQTPQRDLSGVKK